MRVNLCLTYPDGRSSNCQDIEIDTLLPVGSIFCGDMFEVFDDEKKTTVSGIITGYSAYVIPAMRKSYRCVRTMMNVKVERVDKA